MASRKPVPDAQFVLSHPVHMLAFGFGTGLAPIAPGSVGTLSAIPLYLTMQSLPLLTYLVLTGLMLVAGFWICSYTSRVLSFHDHEGIVWDEIVGYLITMSMAPRGWFWIALGFALFRGFDILKPWPVSWFDKNLKGGTGIMMDDAIAAVYGCLLLQLIALWLSH